MTKKHLTDQTFADLHLVDSLHKGLKEAGFEFCTPIQAQSLPPALKGHDIAGQAQTGTGKTIAFLLACCNLLLTKDPMDGHQPGEPRALILAPTRELAIQIHKDALLLNKFTGLSIGLVYGGTGYEQQKGMLAGNNDILIGTPGRLIDFFKQGLFTLRHTQVAVLDEADRMFDLGFIKDIRYLLRKMPPAEKRLNLLYSATLSFRVMELAYEHMNDPMEIKIDTDEVVAAKIVETSYYPADEEKLPLLVNLVKKDAQDRVLVFVNTRSAAEEVARTLEANELSTAMLSGDVPQNKRERLLEQFKTGKRKVLVATDVAARGLHIPSVSHVYNFDLPQDAEDYVHRIGRTARAGASGEAVSFICEKYAYSILDIEEYIGHPLPRNAIAPELLEPVALAPKPMRKEKGGKRRDSHQRGTRKSGRRKTTPENRAIPDFTRSEAPPKAATEPPAQASPEALSEASPKASSKAASESESAFIKKLQSQQFPAPTFVTKSDKGLSGTRESGAQESGAQKPGIRESGAQKSSAGERRPAQGKAESASTSTITPVKTDHPPRFSRRFGEIPAIG